MTKTSILSLLLLVSQVLKAQPADSLLNAREAERIERVLASDSLEGRRIFTPGIERAADFIAAEFSRTGLKPWDKNPGFRQEFSQLRIRQTSLQASWDGQAVDPGKIVLVSPLDSVLVDPDAGFETVRMLPGDNLNKAQALTRAGKNLLVLVDTSLGKLFPRLNGLKRMVEPGDKTVIFLLGAPGATRYRIECRQEVNRAGLANVVGMIPGKSRKNEFVIFSAHYDHLGIGKPVNGDSIFNGANDDAAGTTAVIMLARYFKALGNNERTLVFVAFTAEEAGGFGARYFSLHLEPEKVVAMFNIEMIGTQSKWGPQSAFITGFEKSDMGTILQRNLQGSPFQFYPDPYPSEHLFYRSDNATLARLGVPAHTISTAKMDAEPNYHKVSDEIGSLDLENMAGIIRAIARSAGGIINGRETPGRIDPSGLQ